MGLISKTREAKAEKVAEAAQAAWDEGRQAFVHKAVALTGNSDKALTMAVDSVLAIGWKLHSTAALFNTNGMNSEVIFFTFVR